MSSNFRSSPSQTTHSGTLLVEVPHWATQVHVYDNLGRPVLHLGQMEKTIDASDGLEAKASLPPGIYEVETKLDGKTNRQTVIILEGKPCTITKDKWKNLKATSAAPYQNTSTAREWHTQPAKEWSKQTTWASSGDSRLFLFVRTLKPEKFTKFSESLSLLKGDGTLLTDFSEGVQKDSSKGWLAFNADLPAGYYILKRSGHSIKKKFQPLYLSAGWETHIFLAAEKYPSFRTLSYNMVRRGEGFRPDNKTAIAAEAILNTLNRHSAEDQLITIENVNLLLKGDLDNPWLGILIAYVLQLWKAKQLTNRQSSTSSEWEKVKDYLPAVLKFLSAEFPDHPDIQTLRLNDNQPAKKSFWYPPLLRVGLQKIQQHAITHVTTIPLNSLTDCVLEGVLGNSPWTVWRTLCRQPVFPDEESQSDSLLESDSIVYTSKKEFYIDSKLQQWDNQQSILESVSPKLPAYPSSATSIDNSTSKSTPKPSDHKYSILNEISLINVAQEWIDKSENSVLPTNIQINVAELSDSILKNVQVREISKASGLPLSRVESYLSNLQNDESKTNKPLTATDQTILAYAIQKKSAITEQQDNSSTTNDEDAHFEGKEAKAKTTTIKKPGNILPDITIEGCINKLNTEVYRLLQSTNQPSDSIEERQLAGRLEGLADKLLTAADLSIITDSSGKKTISINGAFIYLKDKYKNAEKILLDQLMKAPLGESFLILSDTSTIPPKWKLQRTLIEDNVQKIPAAYLNVLHNSEGIQLTKEKLQEIDKQLAKLTLLTSSITYKPEYISNSSESINQLKSFIIDIENLLLNV